MHIDQLSRRGVLIRAAASLAFSVTLLGCATRVPAADIARIKTVGVVSFAGSRLRMASVRPVLAGIRTTNEIGDWGVDAIIVEEAAKVLKPRFGVLPVSYGTASLLEDLTAMPLREAARKNVMPAAVDAYVVISPIYQRDILLGADPPAGITLFDNRRVTGTTTTLNINAEMTLFDAQTFDQLASRQVSFPIGSDTLHPQIGLVVESGLWADGFEMLSADQKTKLQAILKVLIQTEIPATLKELGMSS
jgi:hypothetical protein